MTSVFTEHGQTMDQTGERKDTTYRNVKAKKIFILPCFLQYAIDKASGDQCRVH